MRYATLAFALLAQALHHQQPLSVHATVPEWTAPADADLTVTYGGGGGCTLNACDQYRAFWRDTMGVDAEMEKQCAGKSGTGPIEIKEWN